MLLPFFLVSTLVVTQSYPERAIKPFECLITTEPSSCHPNAVLKTRQGGEKFDYTAGPEARSPRTIRATGKEKYLNSWMFATETS